MNKLILTAAALLALSAPAFAESDNLELQAERNRQAIEASLPAGEIGQFAMSAEVGAPAIAFGPEQGFADSGRPTWSGDR